MGIRDNGVVNGYATDARTSPKKHILSCQCTRGCTMLEHVMPVIDLLATLFNIDKATTLNCSRLLEQGEMCIDRTTMFTIVNMVIPPC